MAFGGDVDTLSLTFDKLQYIFNGYGPIRDSFLEVNTSYKQGRTPDAEFFDKILEGVMRFSALEFLAIKAVFEIKKSLDRNTTSVNTTNTTTGISATLLPPPSHSVASFIMAGVLPKSQQISEPTKQEIMCPNCGKHLKKNANFCSNCGKKMGQN